MFNQRARPARAHAEWKRENGKLLLTINLNNRFAAVSDVRTRHERDASECHFFMSAYYPYFRKRFLIYFRGNFSENAS